MPPKSEPPPQLADYFAADEGRQLLSGLVAEALAASPLTTDLSAQAVAYFMSDAGRQLLGGIVAEFMAANAAQSDAAPQAVAYFASDAGRQLIGGLMAEALATHPAISSKLATADTAALDAFSITDAAELFQLPEKDLLSCRYYADQGRYVAVTTDGRKLEMAEDGGDHAA